MKPSRLHAFLVLCSAVLVLAFGPGCRTDGDPTAVAPRTGDVRAKQVGTPVSSESAPDRGTPVAADPLASGHARLLALARQENRALEHVRTLTREHPRRLTGSRGYDRAAAWALEQFRAMGLDARLERWGEYPVAFDRGRQIGRIVTPVEQPLTFASMAWTPGTQGPARGRAVLEPRTPEELAALDPARDLAGAWIVRRESKEGAKFRRTLREAYAQHAILGIVQTGSKSGLLTMGGRPPREGDKDREAAAATPTFKLLAEQYDALVARLEAGETVELEFDVENVSVPGPVPCSNVVADLVGSRFPDEYVIVQGHLDAWDGAEGAQDNGTGVATTLEAARLLSALGVRPLRTVRFVLYGGEEQGLLGSAGYVRDHAAELPRTSVVLTHDAGGTFLSGLDATYAMRADVERACAPLRDLDPRFPFTIHEVDGLVNTGDSDHAPFIEAGVPSFFWHQSEEGYERVHHTQHDVFSEIDPAQLAHSAVVVAVAAWGFGNLEHPLDRTDMTPIPRRRIGVQFDATGTVVRVTEDGRAAAAGWKVGDRVVGVDGVPTATQDEVLTHLRGGGPRKVFRLARGGETIESVIDYTGEPGEEERAARAARRAAFLQRAGPAGSR